MSELSDEFTLTIDSLRSVQLNTTKSGSTVLTVEDPGTVAIVEMGQPDLAALCAELARRLSVPANPLTNDDPNPEEA